MTNSAARKVDNVTMEGLKKVFGIIRYPPKKQKVGI